MPFVGALDGEYVIPVQIPVDERVVCPKCGELMGVRQSHRNQGKFVSRHFFHKTNSQDCDGESDIHKRMKTIAYAKLSELYPDATVELEKQVGERIADVCATFQSPKHPYGDGIIVEAQHKHADKEMGHVGREYLNNGYSVFWAYQSDFTGYDMGFTEKRFWKVWPQAVPAPDEWHSTPDYLTRIVESTSDSVEILVPFPLEYYWNLTQTMTQDNNLEQRRADESGETYGKVWIHSKGKRLAWFTVHRTNQDDVLLRLWTKAQKTSRAESFTVILEPEAVEQVANFIPAAQTALNQDSAYKSRDEWHTIASAWLTSPDTDRKAWLSFVKPPNDRIQLSLGRESPSGETEYKTIPRRRNDENRIEELPDVIEDAFRGRNG